MARPQPFMTVLILQELRQNWFIDGEETNRQCVSADTRIDFAQKAKAFL